MTYPAIRNAARNRIVTALADIFAAQASKPGGVPYTSRAVVMSTVRDEAEHLCEATLADGVTLSPLLMAERAADMVHDRWLVALAGYTTSGTFRDAQAVIARGRLS